jgi:hypothetical protein
MIEPNASLLSGWESFYVIVGSSAAALTGLNFVVVALGADRGFLSLPDAKKAYAAFSTPTIVHFCAVLLVSAVLSAPWSDLSWLGRGLDLFGLAGLVYVAIVTRRARSQENYDPVMEDWIWHITLPFVSYGTVLVAGLVFRRNMEAGLFAVAGAVLILLYVGIHNAWDTATYLATERPKGSAESSGTQPPAG